MKDVVPWGRPKDEYVAMFGLNARELSGKILDCAGGPSSFNVELTGEGGSVTSCDPLYQFPAEDTSERIEETYAGVLRNARENVDALCLDVRRLPRAARRGQDGPP